MQTTPLHVTGGSPLSGEWNVQPSKNAALPILAACLLAREPVTLQGIPRLSDIYNVLELMRHLGTAHSWEGEHTLTLHTPEILSTSAPYELVSRMRASFITMGALLSRAGEAMVSMPGGCAFGHRPVDQHIKAFRAMGADISEDAGNFQATRSRPLRGGYVFDMLTVGATQNAMLAAALGDSDVTLENASIDTDVVELSRFLNALGADVQGAGTNTITVRGVRELRGGTFTVIPDRIEAGTMMMAAAATRGELTLRGVRPAHLRSVSAKLQEMGARILEAEDSLHIDARGDLSGVNVTALEFPGFPTDLQPQISALLATAQGTSVVSDRVYPDRLTHVAELNRLGARIVVSEHTQIIEGSRLKGTSVNAADIRAGAALVVGALAAEGETVISGVEFLNRGYERLAERLRGVGANVEQDLPNLDLAMD